MLKTAVLFNIMVKSRISFRIHCGTGSFSKKRTFFFIIWVCLCVWSSWII